VKHFYIRISEYVAGPSMLLPPKCYCPLNVYPRHTVEIMGQVARDLARTTPESGPEVPTLREAPTKEKAPTFSD
jgi:hypothetical protein